MSATTGKLLIIGFGPGHFEHITDRARAALQEADVIIGYNTYVDLIRGLLTDQEIVRTGMTEEVSRAVEAVRQAEMGKKVAVISSGDAGVYGMAGLVYEVLIEKGWTEADGVAVEVIPGISAVNSCASLLGAPVMHDSCCISLSDHLTPWELIARRVEAAGMGDFIVALYNPRSGRRTRQIVETQKILLKYRPAETPVGLVKSAYRERQEVVITTLGQMLEHDIGMLTTVIIGNSSTFVYDGKMITPRGYQRKYTLSQADQPIRMNERLQEQHEPWALHQGVSERERARQEGTVRAAGTVEGEDVVAAVLGGHQVTGMSETVPVVLGDAVGSAGVVGAKEAASMQGGTSTAVPVVLGDAVGSAGAVGAKEAASMQGGTSTAVLERMAEERSELGVSSKPSLDMAMEAVSLLVQRGVIETQIAVRPAAVSHFDAMPAILEIAVSPGVANKKISAKQMAALLDIVGEDGEIEYTPHHYVLVRVVTKQPEHIVRELQQVGLSVQPTGSVVQIKACDFCNGEKAESIPQAEEIAARLAGLAVPKELKIGFAGCAMACYGSINEDIAMIFRRGRYDLFLGGKAIGRNAHPAQRVAEGVSADEAVTLVERIVREYKEKGHPDERFHKFFKRVGVVAGFRHEDHAAPVIADAVCGD